MSKILVAGGAGFLGSNLCHRLIDWGNQVYCVDDRSTGSERNISDLYSSNRFHFLPVDVTETPDIKVDEIYHLASPTAPGAYKANPVGTLRANLAGTTTLLKLATRHKAKMLFTSSIRVTEELEVFSQHACYVEGKRTGEKLCEAYHRSEGTDVKIARLFNTYGPGMATNDSRVVPQFVTRALRGDPLKIAGDGLQKDSFCYVTDMVDALMSYMRSDVKIGPMEFGYPDGISILDLAKLAIKMTRSSSSIEFNGIERSAREMEIKHQRPMPDIAEARWRLGWAPKIPLDQGIFKLAEHFRQEIKQT